MAIDEALVERLRKALAQRTDITERRMFGGLAFLAGGHILVAAGRKGDLMVRVESSDARDALLGLDGVSPMTMGAKMVDRFVRVSADVVVSPKALQTWIARASKALESSATEPPKPRRKKTPQRKKSPLR